VGSLTDAADLLALLRERPAEVEVGRSLFVGIDGRSGSGKSTLAARLVEELATGAMPVAAVVVEGDDFYAGGTGARWDRRSAEEKADQVIDWRRQRAVLEGLRDWGVATFHPFDWDSDVWDHDPPPFTDDPITIESASIVILEGAYSCCPELHDLLDLRVLVEVPTDVRRARLLEREGEDYRADWESRWSEAEAHYFDVVMPPARFDLVVDDL
jgi:uridine kinase